MKPSWLVQPQDTLSDIGDSKTLHCMANGLPSVTYSWYFNAQRLTIEKEYSIAGGNLTISPIERSHSGMYQCSASNIHGALISSARLQVIGMCNFAFKIGSPVTFKLGILVSL